MEAVTADEKFRKEFARAVFSLWIPHPPVKHQPARKRHKRLPVLTISRRVAAYEVPMIRRPD